MSTDPILVGLDVGGTKILAVGMERVPTGGTLHQDSASSAKPERVPMGAVAPVAVAEYQVPTPEVASELVDALVACVATVSAGRPIAAVGVGLPAFLGLDGVARRAPHLHTVVGVDVGAELRARLGVPVHIDNDANCAAWAAHRIDAPTSRSVVAVTLGTGIGAGLILDGHLLRGAHGFAGEPGHMIVDADGPQCACGQHGCWEVWASGAGLARVAQREAAEARLPEMLAAVGGELDAIDSPMVTRAAAAGSSEALAVLERYGWWVAVGLLNLVNIVDPATIVLGGGIVADGDLVLDPIRRQLATFATIDGVASAPVDLRISALGPSAGAIGAALLAGSTGIVGQL